MSTEQKNELKNENLTEEENIKKEEERELELEEEAMDRLVEENEEEGEYDDESEGEEEGEYEKTELKDTWTLWFDGKPEAAKKLNMGDIEGYKSGLKEVFTFSTIEDFWCLQNSVEPISNLPLKTNYRLFKKGIKPAWEEKANENGGGWFFQMNSATTKKQKLDSVWERSLLCLIGDLFEHSEYINGINCNVKFGIIRIELWLSIGDKEKDGETIEKIGRSFMKCSGIPDTESGYFFRKWFGGKKSKPFLFKFDRTKKDFKKKMFGGRKGGYQRQGGRRGRGGYRGRGRGGYSSRGKGGGRFRGGKK